MLLELFPFVILNNAMAFVYMYIFSLTFLRFDTSLLLLTITLRGYLISIAYCLYTPGIYAEGYIVFVFPFVCSFVRSFVLPSVTWNLRQSFALKFLKWCISQQLLIRKHSYLDHSYPGGLAFSL